MDDGDPTRTRTLRTLLLLGLLIVVAGSAAAAYLVGRLTEDELLAVDIRHVTEHVRLQVDDHLRGTVRLGALEAFTHDLLEIPGVFRVKLWDASGRILWANDARLVGQSFPDNPEFQRARDGGRVVASVARPIGDEHRFERDRRRVREIYVPVAPGLVTAVAVVEVYLDATEMEQQISRAQLVLGGVAATIGLGLYALLALAVWGTSITLRAARAREQNDLDERLRLVERLRAFGEVAAGATHDLGNVFQVLAGRFELFAGKMPPAEREKLAVVRKTLADGIDITRRLRRIGRTDDPKDFEPLCLRALVDEVLKMTEPRWRQCAGVEVESRLDEVPPVLGRPSELREVVTNLVLNALDAMPAGGRLTVATSRRNGHACIDVSDSGTGIPDDVRKRLFVPFVTTKPNGTGLGLSVSYGIVKRHGGRIDVETTEGRGSRFTVCLPVAAAPSTEP